MAEQIEQADFVLLICTETYKRRAEGKEDPPAGAGASWEGAIIRVDLYEANGHNDKFIPVLMRPEDRDHRPHFLRDYSYFVASELEGYRNLCQVLGPRTADHTAGPAIWHIPPPNPYFYGRQTYLKNLHDVFANNNQPVALKQAIKGLGGMGKTQAALNYAHDYRAEYATGLWVVADTRDKLVSGFAEFARLVGGPGREDADILKAAAAGKHWFDSNSNWLLILDNVEDWEIVREWIPSSNKLGHVLITTRLQFTGTFAAGLDLAKLSPDEGTEFLLARAKIDSPGDVDLLAVKSIVREFDGLPLGMEQAGAFIEEAKLSPQEYLDLYKEEGAKLRDRSSGFADHDTVTVTFSMAFSKLSEPARQIVRQAAFLAPDAIPEELLAQSEQVDLRFRDAMADAIRFSLVHRNASSRTIEIHRLVQAVVQDSMDTDTRSQWIRQNTAAINKQFPKEVDFANWPKFERLLPHALVVARALGELDVDSEDGAALLHQTGWYLLDRGRWPDAEPLIRRAVEIREKALGPEHPDTATSLNDLAGSTYKDCSTTMLNASISKPWSSERGRWGRSIRTLL